MVDILLQTLPFFAIVGLGYGAAARGMFDAGATAALTRFVFYFALPAMLFRFAARLDLAALFDWSFVFAYLSGSAAVYLLVFAVALGRRCGIEEATIEAQCGAVGNVGFIAVPMLVMLLGEAALGPVMFVLAIDLIVFGSLIVVMISARRAGRVSPRVLVPVGVGLAKNPMVMSMALGLVWAWLTLPVPGPVDDVLVLLGAAATPGALFAIGASLAGRSAERLAVAGWLSFAKLVLHPAAVALAALVLFPVAPFSAAVMIAAAAMPVAGNVFILAQHYGIAPGRASAAILVSTAASVVTVTAVIGWVTG